MIKERICVLNTQRCGSLPKLGMSIPIKRMRLFGDIYWGPISLGNYHVIRNGILASIQPPAVPHTSGFVC